MKVRNIIIYSLALLILAGLAFSHQAYIPARYFNRNGEIEFPNGQKVFTDTLTPTMASGFAVDLTKAAFDTIQSVYLSCSRNTTDASAVAHAEVNTLTNSTLTLNITQGNSSVVSLLGVNVLSGAPQAMATNLSNIRVFVTVRGK